jgi:antitoxin (DNA-binding transcriptional repressor) of toxin-antitoxin stability system
MRSVELDDTGMSLAEGARRAGEEPLILTNHGKPVAVLLPLDNTDLETASLSSNPRFLDLIERSRSRLRREGGIPSDEVRRRLRLG